MNLKKLLWCLALVAGALSLVGGVALCFVAESALKGGIAILFFAIGGILMIYSCDRIHSLDYRDSCSKR